MTTPHVIVPCAGFGQRFKNAGYAEDKPLIRVGGKRLIDWVLDCVSEEWRSRLIFILRHGQTRLAEELSNLEGCADAKIVMLPGPTQGAACTVLAAAVGLPADEPVLVMNSDQWFSIGNVRTLEMIDTLQVLDLSEDTTADPIATAIRNLRDVHEWGLRADLDGFILTFPGTGPAWSYAVTNGSNRVVHVIEKKQVSPYATVGVYWWRRAGDLVRSICSMIAVGERTKGEFYLAPSINFLTPSDKNVQIIPVEEFHGLGTPEQVREFEALLNSGWRPLCV